MGRLSAVSSAVALLLSFLPGWACAAPAMWLVRDADTEIYLFGTMHVLTPAAAWRTRAYDAAYDRAQTVWFEADLTSADPPALTDLVARYGVDPKRPLSAKLAQREMRALKPLLERGRVPLARIEHMRPWAAALMLSTRALGRGGGTVAHGADLAVTRQAKQAAKTVRAFETVEDQVRMFAGLSEPGELQYLSDVIRERSTPVRRGEPSLQDAWIAGDMQRLGPGLVGDMRQASPEFYDMLLRRRNLAWAQTLEREMVAPGGVHLVNVGALHMVGDDGLPTLLAARGYEVRRIQ